MTDELFQVPTDPYLDPRIRRWDEVLSRPGAGAVLEVDWPPYVLGQTSPEMTIHFNPADGSEQTAEPLAWDDELNELLVARSIRAEDRQQEALRFSLALRAAFRKASYENGDGYFDGVFFAVLKETMLADLSQLKKLVADLDYIHITKKADIDVRYERCYVMIKKAVFTKAFELNTRLKYPRKEAMSILVAALVDYIDRRFSVSIRRQRGWL